MSEKMLRAYKIETGRLIGQSVSRIIGDNPDFGQVEGVPRHLLRTSMSPVVTREQATDIVMFHQDAEKSRPKMFSRSNHNNVLYFWGDEPIALRLNTELVWMS